MPVRGNTCFEKNIPVCLYCIRVFTLPYSIYEYTVYLVHHVYDVQMSLTSDINIYINLQSTVKCWYAVALRGNTTAHVDDDIGNQVYQVMFLE